MKKVLIRAMKFIANEMRKMVALVMKNKNLETDSYLYDMTTSLRRDLGIIRRGSQYVLHAAGKPICILNKCKSVYILDMNRFQKIKHHLMRIGGTPKVAYKNIDELFESKMCNGEKPVAVTIKR